ncbi:hypothetical protein B0T11DRAFT_278626 [Plectosphaerella cucumerina]|uniref:Uncharacterized protein n=1 Tax=Plectosphaerella cucumerina TaxID=40658 RepID=A0A8K0X6X3_9PEZI|nr:hypothetical protein B0T11DRAFT_278626 [Plectosphaerella cucumerina]
MSQLSFAPGLSTLILHIPAFKHKIIITTRFVVQKTRIQIMAGAEAQKDHRRDERYQRPPITTKGRPPNSSARHIGLLEHDVPRGASMDRPRRGSSASQQRGQNDRITPEGRGQDVQRPSFRDMGSSIKGFSFRSGLSGMRETLFGSAINSERRRWQSFADGEGRDRELQDMRHARRQNVLEKSSRDLRRHSLSDDGRGVFMHGHQRQEPTIKVEVAGEADRREEEPQPDRCEETRQEDRPEAARHKVRPPIIRREVSSKSGAASTPQEKQVDISKALPPTPPAEEGCFPPVPPPVETPASPNVEEEITQLLEENKKQKQLIARLQRDRKTAAGRNINTPFKSSLAQPESVLRDDLKNLAYRIFNLVFNHFSTWHEEDRVTWARRAKDALVEITPDPVQAAADPNAGLALMQAAIWNVLTKLVFGEVDAVPPMCWAGRHGDGLSRLASTLHQDFSHRDARRHRAAYTQWRAMTASLISDIQPPSAHEPEAIPVLDKLVSFLALDRCRIPTHDQCRRDLRVVVEKAIDLDLRLAGQPASYAVGWPEGVGFDATFDPDIMVKTEDGELSERVWFSIQPCLFVRGDKDLDNTVLEKCTIWMRPY